ncbi:MAG: YdcF family protein [Fibrobacter sp.]|nr:YdcF family protein [Fibrobacter sp.]
MLKKVSIILLSGIVLFLGGTIVFKNIANWLIVSDAVPKNLNIVFTFAGEGVRVNYSRSLMQKYSEATWVLSDYEDGYARLLRKNKFNMDRVVVVDTCKNTKSEVNALAQWVDQNKPVSDSGSTISIGLVSSPYHMRRIKMMINRRFKDKNIKFHYLPVPLKQYKWTSEMVQYWWKTSEVSKVVFIELQKIVYYFLIL